MRPGDLPLPLPPSGATAVAAPAVAAAVAAPAIAAAVAAAVAAAALRPALRPAVAATAVAAYAHLRRLGRADRSRKVQKGRHR